MDRRSLIKNAGIAGVLAAGIAPAVHAQAAVRWRLASSFPRSLDTIFGSAETLSKTVKALSGGKFEISVHPAGELMPAFGVVDALQADTLESFRRCEPHLQPLEFRWITADDRDLGKQWLARLRFHLDLTEPERSGRPGQQGQRAGKHDRIGN